MERQDGLKITFSAKWPPRPYSEGGPVDGVLARPGERKTYPVKKRDTANLINFYTQLVSWQQQKTTLNTGYVLLGRNPSKITAFLVESFKEL